MKNHMEENIRWTNPNNRKTWCFSKRKITNDLINIREEIAASLDIPVKVKTLLIV